MKTKFFLFLALSFFSQLSRADIIIDDVVTWVDNENITENIIIKDGGELTINCIITMGDPDPNSEMLKIIVEDGGRLVSDPDVLGGVNSLGDGKFSSIEVAGTTCDGNESFIALELDNFFIDGAEGISGALYIKTSDPEVNAKILVKNTKFSNSYIYVTTQFNANNYLNSCNSVEFVNCEFENSVEQLWPIHLFRLNELTFLNCKFRMSGPWALHSMFNQNVTIKGCTFTNSVRGLIFHGMTNNLIIEDNTFIADNGASTTLAIGIGAAWNPGEVIGGKIANNTFSNFKVGLSIADHANQIDGQIGSMTNVDVFGNTFCNNEIGIQSGKSINCKFNANNFNNCDIGVLFNSKVIDGDEVGNVDPSVRCNLFENCAVSIENDDELLEEFSSKVAGTDPQNRFFGNGIDIKNSTNNMFIYNRYFVPFPGRVDQTVNVSVMNSPLLGQCKREDWLSDCKITEMRKTNPSSSSALNNEDQKVNANLVFPNPSYDHYVNVRLSQSNSELIIYNSSGRTVKAYSGFSEGELQTLDLTTLSKGIYFLQINSSNESSVHKLILN